MQVATLAALTLLLTGLPAHAQSDDSAVPFIPDEESPFFVIQKSDREQAGPRKKREEASASKAFPRNKDAEVNAGRMFTGFFTNMFASVRVMAPPASVSKLTVEPETFSLDERREINVAFVVSNKTGKLIKLDFPTAQRIEILVRDPEGKVVEKWSEDRAFPDEAGVVMINPDERIEYQERIATREMQPGVTYTVEVALANNPDFTKTTQVTPKNAPRKREGQPLPGASPAVPASVPPAEG